MINSLLVVKGAGCDEAKLATEPAYDPPCNVVHDTAVAAHGSQKKIIVISFRSFAFSGLKTKI